MENYHDLSPISKYVESLNESGLIDIKYIKSDQNGDVRVISLNSRCIIGILEHFIVACDRYNQTPSQELLRRVVNDYVFDFYSVNKLAKVDGKSEADINNYSSLLFDSMMYALKSTAVLLKGNENDSEKELNYLRQIIIT